MINSNRKTWVSSDHHLGHANILLPTYDDRPFKDLSHMAEELINRHNSRVDPEDQVYFLGDFSLSTESVEKYLKRFNGKKVLICGNHDKPFKAVMKGTPTQQHWVEKYKEWGFEEVLPYREFIPYWPGPAPFIKYRMAHLPYQGDHTHVDRLTKYRLVDDGTFLICGHRHSKPDSRVRRTDKGTLMFDCGVTGNNYYPYNLNEIIEIINEFS